MEKNSSAIFMLLAAVVLASGCASQQSYELPEGMEGTNLDDFEGLPFDPDDVCPYECCEYMERYYDKFCPQGKACVGNKCVEKQQTPRPGQPLEPQEPDEPAPELPQEPEAEPDTGPEQLAETDKGPVPPAYKAASKPSEIIFSHAVSGDTVVGPIVARSREYAGSITYKLTGTLREAGRDSTGLEDYAAERVFVLDNGRLEWNIDATETESGTLCIYTRAMKSSGNEEISKLNIYEDATGQRAELPGRGMVLSSATNHWKYNSPVLSVDGEILIITSQTNAVKLNKASAICSGAKEDGSFTRNDTLAVEFPLILVNFDESKLSHAGSAKIRERINNEQEVTIISGDPNVRFKNMSIIMTPGNLSALGANREWDISWKLELPEKA
ncbi:MAG TPA: hypothetical protein HA254_03970 [Candidatus Diapherotrites archaeon]|uniref:Uncharacterized protein n=1 Tax=Candidatus Iainarchaeum sp. TaxID=3101447 RepID=A0A7J4IWA6_9ARCH|nr:hypothetical protein [Candidatus Diapherotrites archaeon]